MARPPRDTSAGIFHVYTHSVWAVPLLYRDDVDRLEFLRHLAAVCRRPGFTCMCFVLMANHYHLIVDVQDEVLPVAMQALNWPYAWTFNRRWSLRGHVQFDRYGSRRIADEDDLLGTYSYVVNNPVEAGRCRAPEEWPWSSFGGTVGLAERHSFIDDLRILRCFEWPAVDPAVALRRHVTKS